MENDHGSAPPATRETPAASAHENRAPNAFSRAELEPIDDSEAERTDIEANFKARLASLRRMPRYQRPLALRAAREWRMLAINALREKRMRERGARITLWRQREPPSPPQPN